jgi:glycosyltransferase involved in cell wall biosynthesis
VYLLAGPTAGPEGSLVAQARALPGVRYEEISHLVRNIRPWHDYLALRQLRSRLAALQPDVIHTHSSKAGILGRAAASACPQSAVIHTIHGQSFHGNQNPFVRQFYARLERRAARTSDRLISVSDAMTEQAVAAYVAPREKFVTVYSGMEVEKFLNPAEPPGRVRERYRIPAEAILVTKVARLFHLKGHADVLRAVASLTGRHPTLYLLLVGDGILRRRLERLADRLGLRDRIRFAGLVPPEAVPSLLHASDLVVHASLHEGLARVLPQSLLSGRPVISYDVDGAGEVVRTGETGLLVAPGDWRGLARAIDTLVSDRLLRQRLGERGRELCRDRFDHRHMVDEIEKVYLAALAARRR